MEQKKDVDGLIKALKNRDSQVRRSASAALGKIADKRAMEPLAQALKDKDDFVRGEAAATLCRIGDSTVVEPLIQALKDKYWLVRLNAVKALGTIGDPRADYPLAQALGDETKSIRIQAAEALGRRNDLWAFETLAKALKNEEIEVRIRAAEALGRRNDLRALETLAQALKDEETEVRRRAIRTLCKMKDERVLELLIQALRDNDWSVRTEVARILGRKSDPRVIEPLIKATEDEDSIVRVEAAEALEKLGHHRTVGIPIRDALEELKPGVTLEYEDALTILSTGHRSGEPDSKLVEKLFKLTGNKYLSVFIDVMKNTSFDWQTRVYALLAASMTRNEYVQNAIRELTDSFGPELPISAKYLTSALYRQNDVEYLKKINKILSAAYLQTKDLMLGQALIYIKWAIGALSRKIDVEWCPYLDTHGVCIQKPYVRACIWVDGAEFPHSDNPTLYRIPKSDTYNYEECTRNARREPNPFSDVELDLFEIRLMYARKM